MKKLFLLFFIILNISLYSQHVNKYADSTSQNGGMSINGNLTISKNAGTGQVLTSDIFGHATWQTLPVGDTVQEWKLIGNGGSHAATNYIGTTDNQSFIIGNPYGHAIDAIDTSVNIYGSKFNLYTTTGIPIITYTNQTSSILFSKPIQIQDGSQGANKVLTSNINGLGSWQTIPIFNGWSLTGNAGTNPASDFLGTIDGATMLAGDKLDTIEMVLGVKAGVKTFGVLANKITFTNTSKTIPIMVLTDADTLTTVQNIQIKGGNPNIGYTLTSDANGNASWQGVLNDPSNVISVDFNNRYLANAAGINVIQYNAGTLVDLNSGFSVDWFNHQLLDNENLVSEDYIRRALLDSLGNTTLYWNNGSAGTGLQIPNGAANGRILTSDANGNTSWNPHGVLYSDSNTTYITPHQLSIAAMSGPTGSQGPAGANGTNGATGPTGIQGVQGVTGPTGVVDSTIYSTKAYVQNTIAQIPLQNIKGNDTLVTPSTGGSFTCAIGQTGVIFIGSVTAITYTLRLPANPIDGMRFLVKGNGTSLITTLTIVTTDGSSVDGLLSTGFGLNATNSLTGIIIVYHKANNTWY